MCQQCKDADDLNKNHNIICLFFGPYTNECEDTKWWCQFRLIDGNTFNDTANLLAMAYSSSIDNAFIRCFEIYLENNNVPTV